MTSLIGRILFVCLLLVSLPSLAFNLCEDEVVSHGNSVLDTTRNRLIGGYRLSQAARSGLSFFSRFRPLIIPHNIETERYVRGIVIRLEAEAISGANITLSLVRERVSEFEKVPDSLKGENAAERAEHLIRALHTWGVSQGWDNSYKEESIHVNLLGTSAQVGIPYARLRRAVALMGESRVLELLNLAHSIRNERETLGRILKQQDVFATAPGNYGGKRHAFRRIAGRGNILHNPEFEALFAIATIRYFEQLYVDGDLDQASRQGILDEFNQILNQHLERIVHNAEVINHAGNLYERRVATILNDLGLRILGSGDPGVYQLLQIPHFVKDGEGLADWAADIVAFDPEKQEYVIAEIKPLFETDIDKLKRARKQLARTLAYLKFRHGDNIKVRLMIVSAASNNALDFSYSGYSIRNNLLHKNGNPDQINGINIEVLTPPLIEGTSLIEPNMN